MNTTKLLGLSLALGGLLLAALTPVACSSSDAVTEPPPDAAPGPGTDGGPGTGDGSPGTDSGGDGGSDCFTNPTTYFEIINACVTPDVTKITKNPTLPLEYADGGLPPAQ